MESLSLHWTTMQLSEKLRRRYRRIRTRNRYPQILTWTGALACLRLQKRPPRQGRSKQECLRRFRTQRIDGEQWKLLFLSVRSSPPSTFTKAKQPSSNRKESVKRRRDALLLVSNQALQPPIVILLACGWKRGLRDTFIAAHYQKAKQPSSNQRGGAKRRLDALLLVALSFELV
eukprot:scaffold6037_cov121-Skeletonema_marinoi.AAC.1